MIRNAARVLPRLPTTPRALEETVESLPTTMHPRAVPILTSCGSLRCHATTFPSACCRRADQRSIDRARSFSRCAVSRFQLSNTQVEQKALQCFDSKREVQQARQRAARRRSIASDGSRAHLFPLLLELLTAVVDIGAGVGLSTLSK